MSEEIGESCKPSFVFLKKVVFEIELLIRKYDPFKEKFSKYRLIRIKICIYIYICWAKKI